MSLILGIDPGLLHTGWGIINIRGNRLSFVASGTISPKKNLVMKERLVEIYDQLTHVVGHYGPELCAVEETFMNKNAQTSLKLGHARGAILLTLALAGLPIQEYAATLVKKSIVGVGRADKNQVGVMVKHLLPACDFDSEDAADALAIAICHANHMSFKEGVS